MQCTRLKHYRFVQEQLRAIEGLAKFDVPRAVEAIELGLLQAHRDIEQELCELLARIAPETAAGKLIGAAISVGRKSLTCAVGRTLRRFDPEATSCCLIEQASGPASTRKMVAELAGWLSIPIIQDMAKMLARLAEHDSDNEVKLAALAAFERHRRESGVHKLLEAFPSANSKQQWSLLLAILEAADPYLLADRRDALWLGKILSSDASSRFRWHANLVLQRKQKESCAN